MKSLKERVKELGTVVKLAKDRIKGETSELIGEEITIIDYEFINTGEDKYVAFITKEEPEKFFFGGTVLTNDLTTLDSEGYGSGIRKEGLRVKLSEKPSKNNPKVTYIAVEYL